jgi:hypothetical protein
MDQSIMLPVFREHYSIRLNKVQDIADLLSSLCFCRNISLGNIPDIY